MEIGGVRFSDYTALTRADVGIENTRVQKPELIEAVKAVNNSGIMGEENELSFSSDPDTRRLVVQIVNRKTQEVVNQIPPKYVMNLAKTLKKR